MVEKARARDKFDGAREFVVMKPFVCSGQDIAAGQRFDKSLVSPRKLRQLYDQRYLRHAPVEEPKAARNIQRRTLRSAA